MGSNADQHSTRTVLVVAGPTAVGKTAVSVALAQKLGTAIVSADSRQCYRGMAIGTAQPSAEERRLVPHYFIDAFPVTHPVSAAEYESLALGYLEEVFRTADTAVVCGGTGLYLKALCEGLDEMPPVPPELVAELEKEYREKGLEWLQQQVQAEDPGFYTVGEIQNPMRLLRALSFARATGTSILAYRSTARKERPFRIVKTALDLPRELLYERINRRADVMMAEGLLDEVKALFPYRHLKNLQTVGYTELFDYLEGHCSLEEAVEKIRQHTRNYAKRQLTWFRKDPEFRWFRADDPELIDKLVSLIYSEEK